MCGRYAFTPNEKFYDRFDIENRLENLETSYNVVPGFSMPVITKQNRNNISLMKWGLIPYWAKDPKIGFGMINARAESIGEKASFRMPFERQRCLIPASGFYEWKKTGSEKIPYYIKIKNEDLFAFAGIYDKWTDPSGKEILSYSIITTEPNSLIEKIHNRMPAILDKGDESLWLDKETGFRDLIGLLKPFKAGKMDAFPVSKLVNSPENNSADLIKAVKITEGQKTLF